MRRNFRSHLTSLRIPHGDTNDYKIPNIMASRCPSMAWCSHEISRISMHYFPLWRRSIHDQLSDCLAFVSPNLNFLRRKWHNIIHKNYFKIGEKLPSDSRSTNPMLLFQSFYGVGCLVGVTSISGRKQLAYTVEGTLLSWHEELFLRRRCCVSVCIYMYNFWIIIWFKIYQKNFSEIV
jgi:hypothetical protein